MSGPQISSVFCGSEGHHVWTLDTYRTDTGALALIRHPEEGTAFVTLELAPAGNVWAVVGVPVWQKLLSHPVMEFREAILKDIESSE